MHAFFTLRPLARPLARRARRKVHVLVLLLTPRFLPPQLYTRFNRPYTPLVSFPLRYYLDQTSPIELTLDRTSRLAPIDVGLQLQYCNSLRCTK